MAITLWLMIIPEGYAQVNMRFTGACVPTGAEITFGVQNPTDFTASAICDLVQTCWTTAGFDDRQTDDIALTSILVKLGPNATGNFHLKTMNVPGTQGADTVPPNTAILFTKTTATGGRRGRGRFYLPGYAETGVSDAGVVSGAGITANNAAGTAFLSELVDELIPMALLHSAASPAPYPVTGLVSSASVATQRRRLRR